MIWCLTRKVFYLICYKILHTLRFDVLQERFCIWFVIRYYIRYDLVSYKKGFVSDLLLDITYVMIWCLTRKVLYLICYKILHTLWFGVLQERFCIWSVIKYYIGNDLMSYKKGFLFAIRYYIRYDLVSYKKGFVFVIRYYIRYDLVSYKKGFVFAIRYYIHYDLVSYKKGFVSDLL